MYAVDLSDGTIEYELTQVTKAIAEIKLQLELAKSDSVAGQYKDPVWFREATYALRRKGAWHQELLRERSSRRHQKKLDRNNTLLAYFIEEARLYLPPADFQYIMDKAKSRGEK